MYLHVAANQAASLQLNKSVSIAKDVAVGSVALNSTITPREALVASAASDAAVSSLHLRSVAWGHQLLRYRKSEAMRAHDAERLLDIRMCTLGRP